MQSGSRSERIPEGGQQWLAARHRREPIVSVTSMSRNSTRWRWVTGVLAIALVVTVATFLGVDHTTVSGPPTANVSLWISSPTGGPSVQVPGTVDFTSTRFPHEQVQVSVPRSVYVGVVLAPGTWSVVGRSPHYSGVCWALSGRTVHVPSTGVFDLQVICQTI